MISYILRRLLLLPITLFLILLVNFVILNLAPGIDPSEKAQVSDSGDVSRKADEEVKNAGENSHLQFREHFGLTLPILFNYWPNLEQKDIFKTLQILSTRKYNTDDLEEMPVKDYNQLRVEMGDKARYVMPSLVEILNDKKLPFNVRQEAMRFLIRGGTMQGKVGPNLNAKERVWNKKVARDNSSLRDLLIQDNESEKVIDSKVKKATEWVLANTRKYRFSPKGSSKASIFLFETRFCRYLTKVFTLDFGSIRNDRNRTVISEVTKRFKYSFALAFIPMVLTFFLCQLVGMFMAFYQNRWPDYSLNVITLILYSIPVFVVAPFLIEKVALYRNFPFTEIPFPFSGFNSEDRVYDSYTSIQRLGDIAIHLFLPFIAVMYGSLASQARLSRTAMLEVMRQDFVRTAKAKGCTPSKIWIKHIGRNASVTIVTSLATSLGIILGGSLIVETIFEIDGFGRFFYQAIVNRDFNVVMFSTFIGSMLALVGYLFADIAYTVLDPRVTLD